MSIPPQFSRALLACLTAACATLAYSEAPFGLTPIPANPSTAFESKLGFADGLAYVSTTAGVYSIGGTGLGPLIAPSAPSLGTLSNVSRVVEPSSGGAFVVAEFDGGFSGDSSALFDLNDPTSPVVTWPGRVIGIDQNLRGVGDFSGFPREFLPDGSFQMIPSPWIDNVDITTSGFVLGNTGIPGTLGSATGVIEPDGTLVTHDSFGFPGSISDRLDEGSPNIGFTTNSPRVLYGGGSPIVIDPHITSSLERVMVSESDFVVLSGERDPRAFYPGINPLADDLSTPLVDLFPDLDFLDGSSFFADAGSNQGRIHLLISDDDDLFLFVAPDPTVIPEPASIAIISGVTLLGAARRSQRMR